MKLIFGVRRCFHAGKYLERLVLEYVNSPLGKGS